MAPSRLAPLRLELERLAQLRSAPARLAAVRSLPDRSAHWRLAFEKSYPFKSAVLRSSPEWSVFCWLCSACSVPCSSCPFSCSTWPAFSSHSFWCGCDLASVSSPGSGQRTGAGTTVTEQGARKSYPKGWVHRNLTLL